MILNFFVTLALIGSISIEANLRSKDSNSEANHYRNMNVRPASLNNKKTDLQENSKVVGGTPTIKNRYEYFVWANGCGGMLIAKDIVLTAAHCSSIWSGNVYINIWKGNSQGITQCGVSGTEGADCEKISVASTKMHPDYSSSTIDYDYLLVKLNGMSTKEPVLLVNDADNIANNDQITTLGFGTTSAGGSASTAQLEATVNFKDSNTCGNNYGYASYEITDRMNCGYTQGKDACQGDSGGPFVKKGSASDGSDDILVGIVSWGYGCASNNFPGVYADVLNQRDWIVTEACALTSVSGPCTIGQRETSTDDATPPTPIQPPVQPPVQPPAPTPIEAGIECKAIAKYKSNKKYSKNAVVQFNGEVYKSTTGFDNPTKWVHEGPCLPSPCDGYNNWRASNTYKALDEVVYKEALYEAKKRSKGKKPNKFVGAWRWKDEC